MDHAKKVPFRVCLPAVLSGFVCPAMEDSFRLFCYTVDWLHVAGNEIICFSQNVVTLYNKRQQNPYIFDNKTGRGENKTSDKDTNNSEEEWNREEGKNDRENA